MERPRITYQVRPGGLIIKRPKDKEGKKDANKS